MNEGLASFLPFIIIFVLFYFMLIRPQMKQAKEHKTLLTALKAGDEITSSVIRSIRPGYGLSPKFYTQIMGKKVKQDIQAPYPLSFEDLES